jgi:GTP 3',8-cyclase
LVSDIVSKSGRIVDLPVTARPHDLLGRPLHDLRISVMDRCNFRCPYCMPKETFHEHYRFLKSTERLSFEEITRLTRLFVQLGVRKVRLTGGEPLLRPNLAELVGELTALDGVQDVALTTNAVLLAQHAAELKANGLHRITVSLDTLDPEIFKQMSGGFGERDRVLEGIRAASDAGLTPIKINSVVERGLNDHTVLDLIDYFRGTGVIVRFIEYMDVGNRNHWNAERVVPSRELVERIGARWPLHPVEENYHGEVAERYAFDDGIGEVGFISSITNPFCGACTRARLSSEGVFYTCLFAREGVSLREPLRAGATDEELLELIRNTWLRRGDRYSELRASLRSGEQPLRKIEMYYIGG